MSSSPTSAETAAEAAADGTADRDPAAAAAVRRGFRSFALIAIGQAVSLFGSRLTTFALGVWAYQRSGAVTDFAIIAFFGLAPSILLGPLIGPLVDRWDRRLAMVLSDGGVGLSTLVLAALFWTGRTDFWTIVLVTALGALFEAFQFPAFSALTPQIVPHAQLGRANGLVEMGNAMSTLLAPLAAGALLAPIGIHGIILIDVATFVFAITVLLLACPPVRPGKAAGGNVVRDGITDADAEDPEASRSTFLHEAAEGWHYLRRHRGLALILGFSFVVNYTFGSIQLLVTPLVLSFADASALGWVASTAGVGLVVGSVAMVAWGGPRRRMRWILILTAFQGIMLGLGGLRADVVWIALATFLYMSVQPVVASSAQTIWQTQVPNEIQGRVFALRRMISAASLPLATLTIAPLADRVFEPALAPGGALVGSVGQMIGVGPGRGVGLLLLLLGALTLVTVAISAGFRDLHDLDKAPPDFMRR